MGILYFINLSITPFSASLGCTGSIVNSIQIESPYYVRANDTLKKYGRAFGQAVYNFYNVHNFEEMNV